MGLTYDFSGARVLVTGGTSGIGHGIARSFDDAGAAVTVTGTRPSTDDYDVDLSAFDYRQCRMTEPDEIDALSRSLTALDVLVNNAGANLPGGRSEYEPDVFDEVVTVNLTGAFRLTMACHELLASSSHEGGAAVVNLASMASYFAVTMVPGYGAAKAGVVQMTKNLAVHWAGDAIRVNAVAPGLVDTAMTAPMKDFEALTRPVLDRTPLGRWGTPDDIAGPVLFLCCDEARFVTGQTLPVDGGYSIA
jgi:NAD(P)-dependent dehydrogenase (short-subunit alcohol dehydrogenase family)